MLPRIRSHLGSANSVGIRRIYAAALDLENTLGRIMLIEPVLVAMPVSVLDDGRRVFAHLLGGWNVVLEYAPVIQVDR